MADNSSLRDAINVSLFCNSFCKSRCGASLDGAVVAFPDGTGASSVGTRGETASTDAVEGSVTLGHKPHPRLEDTWLWVHRLRFS